MRKFVLNSMILPLGKKNSLLLLLRISFACIESVALMDSRYCAVFILSDQTQFIFQIQKQPHEALRQRIVVNYSLKGLALDEIKLYIPYMLKIAGCTEPIFTDDALELFYSSSNGLLRPLNAIARMSLIAGANKNTRVIDSELIYEAQTEVNISA
jgi:type II secretory pathway predicted ATPase ExeA